jgi:hypothetical protein
MRHTKDVYADKMSSIQSDEVRPYISFTNVPNRSEAWGVERLKMLSQNALKYGTCSSFRIHHAK